MGEGGGTANLSHIDCASNFYPVTALMGLRRRPEPFVSCQRNSNTSAAGAGLRHGTGSPSKAPMLPVAANRCQTPGHPWQAPAPAHTAHPCPAMGPPLVPT